MKYISRGKFGWDHGPYWKYLDSAKNLMPAHLFAFASDEGNHDLDSPNSLHDSWLKYWNISEVEKNESTGRRSLQINACFLGPRHDRNIHLKYMGVEKHSIQSPNEITRPPIQTPHGDLLVHELLVVREGLFSHELVFSKGAVFSVEFTDFEHRVESTSEPDGHETARSRPARA